MVDELISISETNRVEEGVWEGGRRRSHGKWNLPNYAVPICKYTTMNWAYMHNYNALVEIIIKEGRPVE